MLAAQLRGMMLTHILGRTVDQILEMMVVHLQQMAGNYPA